MKSYLRYAYAILAVPLSVLLRFAIMPLTGPGTPFITLFPATVIVSLLGGVGPAVLTGVLGVLVSDYFFVAPLHSFDISIDFWSRSAVVVLTSTFVGYVGKVLRDARAEAEKQALALQESQKDLNRAQQVAHTGSWRLDIQRNELSWSDEVYNIFDFPKGAPITYETFLSTVHLDDRKYVDTRWKAALAGEPYDIEHRIVIDGRIKWVREKAYLEFDEGGTLLGGFGIVHDITEIKLVEEKIKNIAKFPAENPFPVLRIAGDGTILYSNPPGLGLLEQWNCEIGQKVPEDWYKLVSKVLKLKRYQVKEANYGKKIFSFATVPISDGGYVNLYGQDITTLKNTEEKLRKSRDELEIRVQERTAELSKSEEKFRLMAETIPDVFWMSTPGFEKMVYVSPAYEKIWGRTCESLYESPKDFIEAIHPEDMEKVKAALGGHAKGFRDLEYRIIRPDGSICWIRDRGFPIHGAQDNILMVTGVAKDITRNKKMDESIKEQARTMDAFFEHTITPIVFLDPNFNFIRVNEAYARVCQKDISEFEGHNHFEFYPDEENQRIFEEVVRTKTPYEAHAKPFTFPDHPEWGITYWDWTLVPVLDNSMEVEFLVFSLEDVTERKHGQDEILANQEQLRALTSELLIAEERERRRVAIDLHDSVGQILAFMKIELGRLRRSGVSAKTAEVLDHVLEQVKEAIKQTRTLTFEISPPELYTIGLESAIQELVLRFAEERNLQCHFETTDEPKPLNEHVRVCLYRSVRELLINALKHAKARKVNITLCKVNDDIQITVEDDGRGFKVSKLDKSSDVRSRGFGLLTIRERMRRIGGKLNIQSDDGQGTKVMLWAPLESQRTERKES